MLATPPQIQTNSQPLNSTNNQCLTIVQHSYCLILIAIPLNIVEISISQYPIIAMSQAQRLNNNEISTIRYHIKRIKIQREPGRVLENAD
jgi:hypothetical protein